MELLNNQEQEGWGENRQRVGAISLALPDVVLRLTVHYTFDYARHDKRLRYLVRGQNLVAQP